MRFYPQILFPGAIFLLLLAGCGKKKTACSPETARILGHAYFLANPISGDYERLADFLEENKSYFEKNGDAIRCAKSLGGRLIDQGLKSFSQGDYDKAYERSLEMGGTMEQAQDVAGSINSGAVDAFMMGEELQWLATVLPEAANGNWTPFETTGTTARDQIRQILPIYNMMITSDPSMNQFMNNMMKQFGPLMEEQIVMLSLMFDNR